MALVYIKIYTLYNYIHIYYLLTYLFTYGMCQWNLAAAAGDLIRMTSEKLAINTDLH